MDEWEAFSNQRGQSLLDEETPTDSDEPNGLDVSVKAITKGYDVLLAQTGSIQNRCGIGIGVGVAAITAFGSRFITVLPFFIEEGHTKSILAAGLMGFFYLVVATVYFLIGFVEDNQYLPVDSNAISQGLWKRPFTEVQLFRIAWINEVINDLNEVATSKKDYLIMGILFFLASVLVFSSIEMAAFIIDPMGVSNGKDN